MPFFWFGSRTAGRSLASGLAPANRISHLGEILLADAPPGNSFGWERRARVRAQPAP